MVKRPCRRTVQWSVVAVDTAAASLIGLGLAVSMVARHAFPARA